MRRICTFVATALMLGWAAAWHWSGNPADGRIQRANASHPAVKYAHAEARPAVVPTAFVPAPARTVAKPSSSPSTMQAGAEHPNDLPPETVEPWHELRGQLEAIEAENLEILQEYDPAGETGGIYLFTAPSDEQIERMRAAASRYADGSAASEEAVEKMLRDYTDFPAPLGIVLVSYNEQEGRDFLVQIATTDLPTLDENGEVTVVGSQLTAGPLTVGSAFGQRYGDYVPQLGE